MTRKSYCGNLLWQSGLTLLVCVAIRSDPVGSKTSRPRKDKKMNNGTSEMMRQLVQNLRWASAYGLVVGLCQSAFCGVWYVDAALGSDANNGQSAASAFASIQKAIDSSGWGDKIIVNDGVYGAISATNQLLTIESVNGADKTIIDGGYPGNDPKGNYRGANLGTGSTMWAVVTNTCLRGFTIRNGHSSYGGGGAVFGTLEKCLLTGNTAGTGGGSWGGLRVECVFDGNTADAGGGMAGGILDRCVITNNTAESGGGVFCSKVSNSLICNNCASSDGGGAWAENNNANGLYCCSLDHCTLYGNLAGNSGGGMYKGVAVNSIFWKNTATTANDAYKAEISYSCVTDVDNKGDGEGMIAGDPCFASEANRDFRLMECSPCINSGSLDSHQYVYEHDIEGNCRVMDGRTDMGAYEADIEDIVGVFLMPVAGGGVVMPSSINIGESVTVNAFGPRPFIGFYTNGVLAATTKTYTLQNVDSDVNLSVEFDLSVSPIEMYASADSIDDLANGDTQSDPMKLQTAIDVSLPGDTIVAADGVYEPIESNGKAVTIRSSNGRESAIIDGGGSNRCATLVAHTSSSSLPADRFGTKLIGFTLRNGIGVGPGGWSSWHGNGGACQGGTLIDCRITGSSSTFGGGGYGSALIDCLIEANSATQGGGLYNCTATNCLIRGNWAGAHGGGTGGGGTYVDCIVEDNISADWAGGGSGPEALRCIFRRNKAEGYGGGVNSGTLQDCVIVNNEASLGGGCSGNYNSTITLINCTVVGNRAGNSGGGIYSSTPFMASHSGESVVCAVVNNSIVWNNFLASGAISNYDTDDFYGGGFKFQYSCTTPLPDGDGNISVAPSFKDENAGDYRLAAESQCVNAGANDYIKTDIHRSYNPRTGQEGYSCYLSSHPIPFSETDIVGDPRIAYGSIDIGAYECQEEPPHTYSDIWGEWSSEEIQSYIVPESVATWAEFSRVIWLSRDAYVKSGVKTEVPPSDGAIVLSLGAMSAPDGLMVSDPPIETEVEHGVSVWRLRVFEDTNTCSLVAVAGKTAFELSTLPSYLANAWVNAVYGQPPAWLDASETEAWYAARSRSRIEWFITLVPQSQWATYCANRVSEAEGTRTRSGENSLSITGFRPDSATAIHNVSVKSSVAGETRLWSKDSLSSTNWTYNGYSLQAPGTTAAGVHSVSNQLFVTATFSESQLDSDGDGIPDVMEEKVYGTNPNKVDSSGDGISDWEKVYRYDLNPRVQDTAGDGISDDEKILSGTDPRVPLTAEQKAAASRSIRYTYDDDDRLTGTFFGLGGASIKTELTPAGNPAEIRNRNVAK